MGDKYDSAIETISRMLDSGLFKDRVAENLDLAIKALREIQSRGRNSNERE